MQIGHLSIYLHIVIHNSILYIVLIHVRGLKKIQHLKICHQYNMAERACSPNQNNNTVGGELTQVLFKQTYFSF